jgi:adenine specific DNA methylase Mod
MQLQWKQKHFAMVYPPTSDNNKKSDPCWLEEKNIHQEIPYTLKLEVTEEIGTPASHNQLIWGDNLLVLQALRDQLEHSPPEEKVKCVYIDPPYNTGVTFDQYKDQFHHQEWLGLMYHRLKLIRSVLRDDGVIFIQVNDTEHPYLELVMDEIFGNDNKLGTIIWRRRQSQANLIKTVSTIHDYILMYAKNKKDHPHTQLHSQLWIEPRIYGHNHMASKEIAAYFGDQNAFATPKPELLLYHIFSLATKPGEWILDCFSGSGTSISVAHKMHRQWIGIELIHTSFRLNHDRLLKVMRSEVHTAVDDLVEWEGGGGFKMLHLQISAPLTNTLPITEYPPDLELTWSHKSSSLNYQWSSDQGFTDIRWVAERKRKQNTVEYPSHLVQSAFFCAPLQMQDASLGIFQEEQYLSLLYHVLQHLKDRLDVSGFCIAYALESNYAATRILMDEVFGRENHISSIIWKNKDENMGRSFDYVILYAKNIDQMKFYKFPPDPSTYRNPDNDPRGPWNSMPLVASQKASNPTFTYTFKNGSIITRKYRYPFHSIEKLERENRLHYTNPPGKMGIPRVKKYLAERLAEYERNGTHGTTPNSIWIIKKCELFEKLLQITTLKGDWILDYFGSIGENGGLAQAASNINRSVITVKLEDKE